MLKHDAGNYEDREKTEETKDTERVPTVETHHRDRDQTDNDREVEHRQGIHFVLEDSESDECAHHCHPNHHYLADKDK
ncbi:MAG: hypothetical protein NVSMB66_0380 [Candidatus Doudnabacteria bacterium]